MVYIIYRRVGLSQTHRHLTPYALRGRDLLLFLYRNLTPMKVLLPVKRVVSGVIAGSCGVTQCQETLRGAIAIGADRAIR